MTIDEKLDKVEQGIDNLSELLDIKSELLVSMLIDGFYYHEVGMDKKQIKIFNGLEKTFKGL